MALSVDVPRAGARAARPSQLAGSGRPELRLFDILAEATQAEALAELHRGLEDPDARHPELHRRCYAHFVAARPRRLGGALALTRRLHRLGVGLDAPDAVGQTPIFFAAREGNVDCIEYLARDKCDVDRQDRHGQTPMFYAAREGRPDAVRLLRRLGAGADVADRRGQTPLFYAAREGHVPCAELLLRLRSCVEARDASGQTPLFYAVREGRVDMIRWFRGAGADFGVRDAGGRTLLASASSAGAHEELARAVGSQAVQGHRAPPAPLRSGPGGARVAGRGARGNGLDRDYAEELGLPGLEEARGMPVAVLRGLLRETDITELLGEAEEQALAFGSVSRNADATHRLQGTWTTHYLHTSAWFQRTFPALHNRLANAVVAVDRERWGLLDAAPCAARLGRPVARTIELHTVHAGGSLADPTHFDSGSLWTLDVMLAKPGEDFSGGEFQTPEDNGQMLKHYFGRGDAVVFVSHKQHCVAPVTRGRRQVLVIEFWHGEARECAHRCTERWGPCAYCLSTSIRDRIANARDRPEGLTAKQCCGFGLPMADTGAAQVLAGIGDPTA